MFVNYNPLFLLKNYPVSNCEKLQNNTTAKLLDKKPDSINDQIFYYLIEKGIIDKTGRLSLDFSHLEVPHLKKAQFDRIQKLFTQPITVKSKDNSFQFDINLKELLSYLKVDRLEIVGGTVYWILGGEFMRQVCKELNIPEELITKDFFSELINPAADIDIRVLGVKDPDTFKKSVCQFLATKLPEKLNHLSFDKKIELILKSGLTKYFTQYDEQSNEHFGVVSFGNRSDFSVDLLFVENLKRNYLFKHDALKIVITRDVNNDEFTSSLNSNSESLLESLILRLTKILNTEQAEGINKEGACMLFSYLAKGWRYHQPGLENTLISTFLNSYNFVILSKLLTNHYPNEPLASAVVCFNACSLMPENKNLILNISKQILSSVEKKQGQNLSLRHFNDLMLHLNEPNINVNEAKIRFDLITGFFQIFGLLATGFINSNTENNELNVIKTMINEKLYYQYKFYSGKKPLHISVKDDLMLAITNFKSNFQKNNSLFKNLKSFTQYFTFEAQELKILEFKVDLIEDTYPNLSTHAFELLQTKDESSLSHHIGFYLLCYSGIVEKNSTYLSTLLVLLPVLLKNENLASIRKNLLYTLVKYWLTTYYKDTLINHSEKIEIFYKNLTTYNVDEKVFSLTFSVFDIPILTTYIFNHWIQDPKIYGLESSCQLIKNFIDHNLYAALKVLERIFSDFDANYNLLKTYLGLIFEAYSKVKNKLIFERDILKLLNLTDQLIDKMVSYKKAPSQDECSVVINIIKQLIRHDFERGSLLLRKLQEKKATTKNFCSILRECPESEKINLALQWNKKYPLDERANFNILQDRIVLLAEAIPEELNSDSAKELGLEIFNKFKIFFKSKTPSFFKIKDALNPKLSWILTQFLNQVDNVNYKEVFTLYFNTIEIINPQNPLSEELTLSLMPTLTKILSKDQSHQIEFVNEVFARFGFRGAGKIFDEELKLYYMMVSSALKNVKSEIAIHFMKKILLQRQASDQLLADELTLLDNCLEMLISNKKLAECVSLLEYFDHLFPRSNILDESKKYKQLFLSLNSTFEIKKFELISNKTHLFLNDESLQDNVIEMTLSLLVNPFLLKDNNFSRLLNIIQLFGLTNPTIIQGLKKFLNQQKNILYSESTFYTFQDMGLALTTLSPFFQPLSSCNSTACLTFLDHYEIILSEFNEKKLWLEKNVFITELTSSFFYLLKARLVNPQEVEKMFLKFEKELKISETFSMTQKIEIDLIYSEIFNSSEDIKILKKVWQKLNLTSLITNDKNVIKELIKLAVKAIRNCIDTNFLENELEPCLLTFLENICLKSDFLDFPPLLEIIDGNNSERILNQKMNLFLKFIEKYSVKKENPYNPVAIKFKSSLKKLIETCFEKNLGKEIKHLFSPKFLTPKEISSYQGRYSKVLFKNPMLLESEKSISKALDSYQLNIEDVNECLDFQQENLLGAIKCLMSLAFDYNNDDLYFEHLSNIKNKILPFIEQNHLYLTPFKLLHYYLNIPVTKNKNGLEIKLMREKIYNFFYHLAKAITTKVIENQDTLTNPQFDIALSNVVHLSYLIPFKAKKNAIISSVLIYSYATSVLSLDKNEPFLECRLGLIYEMQQDNYFSLSDSLKQDEISYELHLLNGLPEYVPERKKGMVILAPLTDQGRATILLEIINRLKVSPKTAFAFLTRHYTFLNKNNPEGTQSLFRGLAKAQSGMPEYQKI